MARYNNYSSGRWPKYVPVAKRRQQAANKVAKLKKAGKGVSPVVIEGRNITTTFWGDAWCENLEHYSDYESRLPRGRSYVRNGLVVDLQVEPGRVRALVSGTSLYTVDIAIEQLPKRKWADIKKKCAGQIGSLVELLQGSLSKGVMEIVTRGGEGLFPSPKEIELGCSCPDWAVLCKHAAAALYGVGARLDHEPALLFTLRGVDPAELVEAAVRQPAGAGRPRKGRVLEASALSAVFGVDIDVGEAPTPVRAARAAKKKAKKKVAKKKRVKKKAKASGRRVKSRSQ